MKIFCIFTIALLTFLNVQSQTEFGATAGLALGNAKVENLGVKLDNNDSGFYIGLLMDNTISEKFHLLGELTYLNIDGFSYLQLPLLGKLYVGNGAFNVQGGVQLRYNLEDVVDDFSKLDIGLGGGLGYDIGDNFLVHVRYFRQVNNSFKGNIPVDSRLHLFNIGFGYKF